MKFSGSDVLNHHIQEYCRTITKFPLYPLANKILLIVTVSLAATQNLFIAVNEVKRRQ